MKESEIIEDNLPPANSPRIVFMGTPAFAVSSLDALVQARYNVVSVITAPDKPAGRGMTMQQSAVKLYAIEHNIPVLQPEKLKDPSFIDLLRDLNADLQVVVAFRMLPEIVWNMPPLGTINVHGSLLPQYRGAAPINWAVINGEKETGVTTFKLQHAIDTGNVLLQEKMPIGENETAGEVHDRMMLLGAQVLVKTIKGLMDNSIAEKSQDENSTIAEHQLKHAPKIFTETCRINWEQTADAVHNLIRGLSPFPGAFTTLNDRMLKIYRSEKVIDKKSSEPGKMETDGKTFLKFACKEGFILVKELQLEGKKRMDVASFLRGHRFA
ncbi:MAG: methionyl-tRNA formyltransferase [Bacteroidota bacterium]